MRNVCRSALLSPLWVLVGPFCARTGVYYASITERMTQGPPRFCLGLLPAESARFLIEKARDFCTKPTLFLIVFCTKSHVFRTFPALFVHSVRPAQRSVSDAVPARGQQLTHRTGPRNKATPKPIEQYAKISGVLSGHIPNG